MKVYSYQDLLVWQKGMELAREIYVLTDALPVSERYGLAGQMQRAAVSIPSNLAEGHVRQHKREFGQFASIALGSVAELETQLLLCTGVGRLNIDKDKAEKALRLIGELKKMIYSLIQGLKNSRLDSSERSDS